MPEMGLGGGGSVMKDREGSRQRCRQTSPSSCRWVRGGLTYAHRTCFSSSARGLLRRLTVALVQGPVNDSSKLRYGLFESQPRKR